MKPTVNKLPGDIDPTAQVAVIASADKTAKPAPKSIRLLRSAIMDDVLSRLGVDEFALLMVLIDAQDRLFDNPAKWWTSQLCSRCGFPSANPHRLRNARNALKADGWITFDLPTNGQRAQVTYTVLDKFPGRLESDPDGICGGKQLTPTPDCRGDDPTPTKTGAVPLQKRAPDPYQICTHSSSSISSSDLSTSREEPPNPLSKGGLEGSDDSLTLDSVGKPEKTNGRKAKTPKVDDVAAIPIPEALATYDFTVAWKDWQAFRRQKRSPLTEIGAKAQLREFQKWGVDRAVAAIDHTILKGWTGIREPDGAAGGDLLAGVREFATNGRPTQTIPSFEEMQARGYNGQTGLGPKRCRS